MLDYAIFGPPGAGKGTQAGALCRHLGLEHFSTGDAFRKAVAVGSDVGVAAKAFMSQGLLVPDDVVLSVVVADLADRRVGVLFDGFPRTVGQAEGLLDALSRRGRRLAGVVNLVVGREAVVARIAHRRTCSCGAIYHLLQSPPMSDGLCDRCGRELLQRADDALEVVQGRLDVYFRETAPVLDMLRRATMVVDIDGEQSVDIVTSTVCGAFSVA